MRKWYIDDVVITNGQQLDKGFYINEDGTISWFGPWENAEEQIFSIADCTFENGTPITVEDGELIGQEI